MRNPKKSVRHIVQSPARPVARTAAKAAGTTAGAPAIPAVARPGRLTLQQLRRAVDTALRGQTFKADA